MNETVENMPAILPPALQRGDVIGLIGPSGPWQEESFRKGIQILTDLGFQVTFARNLLQQEGYLAGSDQHRHTMLTEIWRNPNVKAIMAVRGGYGSLRILADLDYELFRSHPKILIGFSDVTALLTAIAKHTGLITFHGPMLSTLDTSDRKSVHHLFETLCNRTAQPIKPAELEILRPGIARGPLAGGNLTTLTHLVSTPYEMPWQDTIVFIEDIGEAPYRLDRMFTQLNLAGRLKNIRGLILGSFDNCGNKEEIWARVLAIIQEDIPIWANFPVGHCSHNITLPIGAEAEMDSSAGKLTFPAPFLS